MQCFPCIYNVMHHCMLMSCHICNECHMDNINHTFYHVSWTIISHAYNFQINTHQCQYISTHISTFHHIHATTHVITKASNNILKPLILKENVAHDMPTKQPTIAPRSKLYNKSRTSHTPASNNPQQMCRRDS